jgi:hypothetical protein
VPRAILRRHGLAGKRRAEGCGGGPGAPARVRGSVERGTEPRATGERRGQVGRGRAARGRPSGPGEDGLHGEGILHGRENGWAGVGSQFDSLPCIP